MKNPKERLPQDNQQYFTREMERTTLRSLIGSIRGAGTSVLLAERDISILTEACDRMLVLSSGRIIADDVPSRIARNPVVMEAYLNRSQ